MLNKGFVYSHFDSSLFIRKNTTCFTIVAIYVEDIILTSNNISDMQSFKSYLHRIFSIKDLGKLHFFLGLEGTYLNDSIALIYRKFTNDLLRDCGIIDFYNIATPLPLHLKLQNNCFPLYSNATEYRCLVEKLNFLINTGPNLALIMKSLSQYMQSQTVDHYQALQHTLYYDATMSGQGNMVNVSDQLRLHAYFDSDWGACLDTRRSVMGYLILLATSPVSWKSKK